MRAADLPAVIALAGRVHIAHPEAPDVFVERLELFPAGCFALDRGASLLGYAIAHPGRVGAPPPLNSRLGSLPDNANCLYLHDLALAPEARRRGYGADLLARMIELAARSSLDQLALVAVAGSGPFWHRLGFRPFEDAALRAKLASYGADAAYMVRAVRNVEMPDGL